NISSNDEYQGSQTRMEEVTKQTITKNRVILAAALNYAKVKMKRLELLDRGLVVRNGKFAPQTDKEILSYITKRKIDLGKGFFFEKDYNSWSTERLNFGTIRLERGSEYSHPTVVYIKWNSTDHHDLTYHMVKDREGTDRKAIISAAARFMHIFHSKLEPFFDNANQYVGPAAGEKDFAKDD